jgi:hypothetical protein
MILPISCCVPFAATPNLWCKVTAEKGGYAHASTTFSTALADVQHWIFHLKLHLFQSSSIIIYMQKDIWFAVTVSLNNLRISNEYLRCAPLLLCKAVGRFFLSDGNPAVLVPTGGKADASTVQGHKLYCTNMY